MKNQLPFEINRLLKQIQEFSNEGHYNMVKAFCESVFIEQSTKDISQWTVSIINKFYREIIFNKEVTKEVFNELQDKLENCKDSL